MPALTESLTSIKIEPIRLHFAVVRQMRLHDGSFHNEIFTRRKNCKTEYVSLRMVLWKF